MSTNTHYPHCEKAGLKVVNLGSKDFPGMYVVAAEVEAYLQKEYDEMKSALDNATVDAMREAMRAPWKFEDSDFAGPYGQVTSTRASDLANTKLAEWIAQAPVVYGFDQPLSSDPRHHGWTTIPTSIDHRTHTAKLIYIEPIARESEERQLLRELVSATYKRSAFSGEAIEAICIRARKLLEGGEK